MLKINSVKVRMYRHGFGDCFLLQFFEGAKRKTTMLIDCGLKLNDKRDEAPIEAVVKDIKAVLLGKKKLKKPPLDVLVVTHEHWDHVSSFHPDTKLFDDFNIDKIWMAWTEDPEDDDAKVINASLRKRVKAIKLAAEKMKKNTSEKAEFYKTHYKDGDKLLQQRKSYDAVINEVGNFFGPLTATDMSPSGIKFKDKFKISLDTQVAIDHLRSLAKGQSGIAYFSPGTVYLDEDLFPGMRIYVLGPPRSALLNKDRPSTGSKKEVYLGLDDSSLTGFVDGILAMHDADGDLDNNGRPFGEVDVINNDTAEAHPYYKRYFDKDCAWQRVDDDWLDITGALALQMDADTNNTSLVLAFEFVDTGKVLLFPGDAQVGNWLSWHDHTFAVKDANTKKTVTASDLLANTVLYKVGHHASHNATLKEKGLELMVHEELVAFVPEKEKQYNNIPYKPLLKMLRQRARGRVVISADKNYPADKIKDKKPDALSAKEWSDFKNNIEVTPLFVEITIRG